MMFFGRLLAVVALCLVVDRDGPGSVRATFATLHGLNVDRHSQPSTPLFLTPLIQAGQLRKARDLSRVIRVPGMRRSSYSGLLTVRPEHDAHMFFWFFPAEVDSATAPVILWLNGGPGASSLGGLLAENGPYAVTSKLWLQYRPDNWVALFNVIYADSPVGTGYSFANSTAFYSNSSQANAQDLHRVVRQFFSLFADFADNDFYVAGESYGAKFAAWLSKIILDSNAAASTRNGSDVERAINFKGLISVSGLLNLTGQSGWADYLYQSGLLDPEGYAEASSIKRQVLSAAANGSRALAGMTFARYVATDATNSSFLSRATGLASTESVLLTRDPLVFELFQRFVQKPSVRRAIHVGGLTFRQYSPDVFNALLSDVADDVAWLLEEVLQAGSRVLLVSGNMDPIIHPVGYRRVAYALEWTRAAEFRRSRRAVWRVDPRDADVAGYANCGSGLCLVLVRNAGHRMNYGHVRATRDAVRRFVRGLPFDRD